MFAQSSRITVFTIAIALAALELSSCSSTVAARAGSPESYWAAARRTYLAGDYLATVDQLDHLLDEQNEFAARAVPWSLVLTTGLAAGYIELAEDYTRGARNNPAEAAAFRRRAAEYRNLANPLALQAARIVDKLSQLPPGSITLSFGRPRGNLAPTPELYKIAAGLAVTEEEAEAAPIHALERNVLMSACLAVGAPNDSAKASEILGHASTITPRAGFAAAMADMLEKTSTLYARGGLDSPSKLAQLQGRVKVLRTAAEQVGPAMVVKVNAQ